MADEPMHLEPPSFPTIAGISAASNAWGDVNMHVEPATDLEARLMKVAKSCQIHELLADVNPEGEISDAGDGKTAAQQPAELVAAERLEGGDGRGLRGGTALSLGLVRPRAQPGIPRNECVL